MSLLTSAVYPALEGLPGPWEQAGTYTLSHTGVGWTLVTRRSGGAGWSTPLAPHGAGPQAPRRVAQAVGVRVLHELGVEVTGWSTVGDDTAAEVVALTGPGPRHCPRGVRGH